MQIVAVFEVAGMTSAQYDSVIAELERRGLGAPAGRRSHVAAPRPGGWLVVDVWDSEDAFGAFGQTLVPMLAGMGLAVAPQVHPVHALIDGAAAVAA